MEAKGGRPRRHPLGKLSSNAATAASRGVEESKGSGGGKASIEMTATPGSELPPGGPRARPSASPGEAHTDGPLRQNRGHGSSWSESTATSDKRELARSKPAANVEAARADGAGDGDGARDEESDGPPRLPRQHRNLPGADASRAGGGATKPKPKADLSSRAPRAAAFLSAEAFLTLCAALAGVEYLCVFQSQCGTVPPNPAAHNETRIAALLLLTILVFVPAIYVAAETARVGVTSSSSSSSSSSSTAADWIVARQLAIAVVIGVAGLLVGIGAVRRAWESTMTGT